MWSRLRHGADRSGRFAQRGDAATGKYRGQVRAGESAAKVEPLEHITHLASCYWPIQVKLAGAGLKKKVSYALRRKKMPVLAVMDRPKTCNVSVVGFEYMNTDGP
jgi:hypothetical protein